MPIRDLYSKRKKATEQSGQPDVYQYDNVPDNVINQLIMILHDAIGTSGALTNIMKTLAREYGDPSITYSSPEQFLRERKHIDEKLDIIELKFRFIDKVIRAEILPEIQENFGITLNPDEAIFELNYRLREGGVGYQYENGVMIRMDSQFVHAKITKKTLSLLSSAQFSGPQDEFLSAHKHYRHGEYKNAIVDAGASFESTMKSICDTLKWQYERGARASDLLKVLKEHRLFPDYLDKSFDQLLAVLKSGLPEIRNNEGSHGQGSVPKRVPDHVAAYALHLAATNIVFLVECMKDLESQGSK
jgi:AbiJ N-terminal domain 4